MILILFSVVVTQHSHYFSTCSTFKQRAPDPSKLRPAEPRDIVEGAIIYHWREEKYGGWYWHIIDEVQNPNDDFKAYVADDGCQYGLHQAFVE